MDINVVVAFNINRDNKDLKSRQNIHSKNLGEFASCME